MSTGSTPACAACKYQRRKCSPDCPLAPYFPPHQSKQFLNVHRLFGVSNVLRILRQVNPSLKAEAVSSMVIEANIWEWNPIHGCLGLISMLQSQVENLQFELHQTRNQILIIEQSKHISELHSYEPTKSNLNDGERLHVDAQPHIKSCNQSSGFASPVHWDYMDCQKHESTEMHGLHMFDINEADQNIESPSMFHDVTNKKGNKDVEVDVKEIRVVTTYDYHEAQPCNRDVVYSSYHHTPLSSSSSSSTTMNVLKNETMVDLNTPSTTFFSLTRYD
ncbi:hypothetical protein KP509_34G046200 [Ceratopteris richardii]|uniref:LOB domain-containing protein n=1 Tax=Ceratopteris richardii TaxID=49495 RepID=A0A8T2QLK7_CERRI|nr:hypothetical protein KP509_34G046200 [Ceratopteris richardii]